jgi:hypothetical protein
MLNVSSRYAVRVALVLVLGSGLVLQATIPAQAQAQSGTATSSPSADVLGIRMGMPLQQAYDLLKAHDPGHNVVLEQWTIPDLYGDKPITYGMSPSTTGNDESISVDVTLPPNPQVVWRIQRKIGPFTSTRDNVLDALYQKYGTPWVPNPNALSGPNIILDWFFDEQGRLANPGTSRDGVLATNNCQQVMQPWTWSGLPAAQAGAVSNFVIPHGRQSMVTTMPPFLDPSKNPRCNVIHVQAAVRPGATGPTFVMSVSIGDYALQHRTTMALNDAVNAIVERKINQQQKNAEQQSVPKF